MVEKAPSFLSVLINGVSVLRKSLAATSFVRVTIVCSKYLPISAVNQPAMYGLSGVIFYKQKFGQKFGPILANLG